MLRVIHQEQAATQAWDLFLAGNSKKNETYSQYAKRIGAEARTRPPAETSERERANTIRDTQRRLGRLYRAPIKA